jgi:ketosteroid isomerase-like protein
VSQENLEVVRETFDAWNRGDFAAALTAFDPLAEWHTAADEPDAGTYRGIEGVVSVVGGWARSLGDFSANPGAHRRR